jgi:hypothetical protein
MGNQVYANNMEIACKAAEGKSICAFPDVCMTPPETPATPPGVPIPYPNTGMATDCSDGSTTVQISGQEVMLKNKSYFKKSTGDEAGSAPKKGVVTSQITGKVYFNMWSMDVQVEGENVVRHLDLTTHNHASFPGNTSPWPYIDAMEFADPDSPCSDDIARVEDACTGNERQNCRNQACRDARKCMLVPYKPGCCKKPRPADTPHHLVEVHCFTESGGRRARTRLQGFENYDDRDAPCVCVTGSRYTQEHGDMHAIQNTYEMRCMDPDGPRSQMGGAGGAWTYATAKRGGVYAHSRTFEGNGCSDECLELQLDNYHQQDGLDIDDDTELRADRGPLTEEQRQWGGEQVDDLDDDDDVSDTEEEGSDTEEESGDDEDDGEDQGHGDDEYDGQDQGYGDDGGYGDDEDGEDAMDLDNDQ